MHGRREKGFAIICSAKQITLNIPLIHFAEHDLAGDSGCGDERSLAEKTSILANTSNGAVFGAIVAEEARQCWCLMKN